MKRKKPAPKPSTPSILDSENWISQSSLRAANNQGNSSGSGGSQTTISIEFTNPAPPSKIVPCGEEIRGNAKASGPDAGSTSITVTGPNGSVCGDGTGECSFYYAPDSEECGEELTFIASAVNCDSASGTVTEPKVTISEIPRVPVHKNIPANIRKCTITIVPDNIQLDASIERDQSKGTKGLARFEQGGTTIPVKGTTEVSIAGLENSDVAANMRLIVKKGGKIYAEKSFSIRTWPRQGAFNPNQIGRLEGGLLTNFRWLSESGTVQDLDGIFVGEVVTYNPALPSPPYPKPLPPNPTIIHFPGNKFEAGRPNTIGWLQDLQNAGFFVKPYSASENTANQDMGFWDPVLDGPIAANNERLLQGGVKIKRKIVQGPGGSWIYTVEKLGVICKPYTLPE